MFLRILVDLRIGTPGQTRMDLQFMLDWRKMLYAIVTRPLAVNLKGTKVGFDVYLVPEDLAPYHLPYFLRYAQQRRGYSVALHEIPSCRIRRPTHWGVGYSLGTSMEVANKGGHFRFVVSIDPESNQVGVLTEEFEAAMRSRRPCLLGQGKR